jgi:DNA-binding CsgD family transcriptional regulator
MKIGGAGLNRDYPNKLDYCQVVGMGCFFAFIFVFCISETFANMALFGYSFSRLLMLGIILLVLIALLILSSFLGITLNTARFGLAGWSIIAGLSTGVGSLLSQFGESMAGFIASSILICFGSVLLLVTWSYSICQIQLRARVLNSGFAAIVGALLYFCVVVPTGHFAFLVVAVLPLLSGLLAVLFFRRGQRPVSVTATIKLHKVFDWRMLHYTVITGCLFSLIGHALLLDVSDVSDVWFGNAPGFLCMAFFLLAQIALAFNQWKTISPRAAYRPVPLLFAVGFFLLPFANQTVQTISMALAFSGFACYVGFFWIVLGNIAARYRGVPESIFSFGFIMLVIGVAAGELIEMVLRVMSLDSSTHSLAIALIGFFLLVIALWLTSDGAIFANETREMGGAFAEANKTFVSDANMRADALALAFKFSPREKEVLYLVMSGRDVPTICNELSISKNTAQTHIRHIYQKTGISKRQHLFDLADKLTNTPL